MFLFIFRWRKGLLSTCAILLALQQQFAIIANSYNEIVHVIKRLENSGVEMVEALGIIKTSFNLLKAQIQIFKFKLNFLNIDL